MSGSIWWCVTRHKGFAEALTHGVMGTVVTHLYTNMGFISTNGPFVFMNGPFIFMNGSFIFMNGPFIFMNDPFIP